MFLEIVTPESVLLSADVKSVVVPGLDGNFQILDNHAPIVSSLKSGLITIDCAELINHKNASKFQKNKDGRFEFSINSGTIELSNNKAIILAD